MKPKTYNIDGVVYVRARAIEQEAKLIDKLTASMDQSDERVQELRRAAARLLYGPSLSPGPGRGYPMRWHLPLDDFCRYKVAGRGVILAPERTYAGDRPEIGDKVRYNERNYTVTAIESQGERWSLVVRQNEKTLVSQPECPECGKTRDESCCNPKCGGNWGTGCYHCHHPSFHPG